CLAEPAVLELKILQALHLLALQPAKLLAPPIIVTSLTPIWRIASTMFWPCEASTSTCRSFATISSGLYRFLAITVLLDVKDIPQVGPLQWGRINSMLTTTVNLPTRRTPSPQIRARDTSLDGTTNGSAGVNSAPDVDAGVNSAPDLGGQRCRDHEDRGDSTNYRKLAELSLPWAQITEFPLGRVYQLVRVSEDDLILEPLTGQLPPWQRRTNVWRRVTRTGDKNHSCVSKAG